MRGQVDAALRDVLVHGPGWTRTDAEIEALLGMLQTELVTWHLAHTDPWDEDEPARRTGLEVLARALIGAARPGVQRDARVAKRN
jgi:hypothetical protein